MRFRVENVTSKRHVKVPDGWKVEHTFAWQKKGAEPQFSVLLSEGSHQERQRQKESCIGFDLAGDDYEE